MSPKRTEIVNTALKLVGTPSVRYRHGSPELGQSPLDGFDCSGFARYVLDASGLEIPPHVSQSGEIRETRHTNEIWDSYGAIIHQELTMPGDLVFFSRHGYWPTHIGILINRELFVHSPGKDGGKVEISPLSIYGQIEKSTLNDQSHRLAFTHNPVGFKTPTIPHTTNYRVHQILLS